MHNTSLAVLINLFPSSPCLGAMVDEIGMSTSHCSLSSANTTCKQKFWPNKQSPTPAVNEEQLCVAISSIRLGNFVIAAKLTVHSAIFAGTNMTNIDMGLVVMQIVLSTTYHPNYDILYLLRYMFCCMICVNS